jgi:hypothetical protein
MQTQQHLSNTLLSCNRVCLSSDKVFSLFVGLSWFDAGRFMLTMGGAGFCSATSDATIKAQPQLG